MFTCRADKPIFSLQNFIENVKVYLFASEPRLDELMQLWNEIFVWGRLNANFEKINGLVQNKV